MQGIAENFERRTTTDVVFDQLYDEIVSLRLLPGTKLSEADVARRFGVSRQPVRDAFSRLGNLELLLIRPQKATEVRGFSMRHIANARFVRLAVELEVIRHACSVWDETRAGKLEQNLQQQQLAVDNNQQGHVPYDGLPVPQADLRTRRAVACFRDNRGMQTEDRPIVRAELSAVKTSRQRCWRITASSPMR